MSKEEQTIIEKAAEEYALLFEDGTKWKDGGKYKGFIAGAEWQKKQDEKGLTEKIAAAYQLGLANKEEQMMKDAVEGTVTTNLANRPVIYLDQLKGFQYGDKVRIIIVKEE